MRNDFGMAFDANGRVWDATICQADSDGDGITNGAELGDPTYLKNMSETSVVIGQN